MKMDTIEARFNIVTPMFISGADQTKAELRVPSIKGALRFWWRALNYENDSNKLLDNESAIFGSSKQNVGQSKVKIHLKNVDIVKTRIRKKWNVNEWKSYIGYGLSEDQSRDRSGVFREFINQGSKFSLVLYAREKTDSLIDTIKVFSLIGGIGSRSRKGWGSISIIENNMDWNIPDSRDNYKNELKNIIGRCRIHDGLPKYSAISSETKIVVGPSFNDPDIAFGDIGEKYRNHLKSLNIENRDGFGLPRKKNKNRRGSPLMIHVHQCDDEFFWVCTFMKSRFTDSDDEPHGRGYGPIEEFLGNIGGDSI